MAKSAVSKFLGRVKTLTTKLQKDSDVTEEIVIESVYLLYEHGNIATVNAVIDMFEAVPSLTGIRALVTWYKGIVPFGFKDGRFTEVSKAKAKTMGKVGTGEIPDNVREYCLEKAWYEHSKEAVAKAYTLSANRLAATIHNAVKKAREAGTLTDELFADMDRAVRKALTEEKKKLHTVEEIDATTGEVIQLSA